MRIWRLRPRGEFERVRQHGRSTSHRLLVIIVQARAAEPEAPPRIGVAAGKRLGNAVIRNRIRRRTRAAVQQIYPRLAPGWDIIIISRAPAVEASVQDITTALQDVFSRAGVWRGPAKG